MVIIIQFNFMSKRSFVKMSQNVFLVPSWTIIIIIQYDIMIYLSYHIICLLSTFTILKNKKRYHLELHFHNIKKKMIIWNSIWKSDVTFISINFILDLIRFLNFLFLCLILKFKLCFILIFINHQIFNQLINSIQIYFDFL